MNLCQNNHEEICYESRNCPLCEMRQEKDNEIEELEKDISDLKDELKDNENTINQLEEEKETLENKGE